MPSMELGEWEVVFIYMITTDLHHRWWRREKLLSVSIRKTKAVFDTKLQSQLFAFTFSQLAEYFIQINLQLSREGLRTLLKGPTVIE